MSRFEYVTVFISIVMALAVAELLLGLGRLVRERRRVSGYWVYPGTMLVAILGITLHWWSTWSFESVPLERYGSFLAILAPSFTYVVIAVFLTPDVTPSGTIDLRGQFVGIRRWASGLGALLIAEFALVRTTLLDEPWLSTANGMRLALVAVFVCGAAVPDSWVRRGAPFVVAGMLALFALLILYS